MSATRTVNPLHFEDLEPHRFEDLVRQLAYDLRNWSSIEATGRVGSDDGFDTRAIESVSIQGDSDSEEDEREMEHRTWLIQCKREKRITPKKLESYAADCLSGNSNIYGAIVAAPCHFSKRARDAFIEKVREHGVKEYLIWGKAELEDLLFQPKNDHLLFAYFQISLQVNRRATKTRLRSKLAIKKKAINVLGDLRGYSGGSVLLRDPEETRYPYYQEVQDFDRYPPWEVYEFKGHYYDGIKLLASKYFAYLDDDGVHFDMAKVYNDSSPYDNPWPRSVHSNQLRQELWEVWLEIPEKNRAWIEIVGAIPYEKIMAIDEEGDEEFEGPHIYVPFSKNNGPFEDSYYVSITNSNGGDPKLPPDLDNRISYFPKKYRDRKIED